MTLVFARAISAFGFSQSLQASARSRPSRGVADLGAASQALGHSDLSTTAAIYGHYDLSDLERAMDALARARREREEPADWKRFNRPARQTARLSRKVEAAGVEPAQDFNRRPMLCTDQHGGDEGSVGGYA